MPYTAEIVTVTTTDGITLAGSLRRPPTTGASEIGADVMILHHGASGNFYRSRLFDTVSGHLLAAGCAVLRVNSRGHDVITTEPQGGRLARVGAGFETVSECVQDWRAWTDFAEGQGFRAIGLWGHSLGGVKTIYYLSVEGDARVVCAVASSPPRFNFPMYLADPDGEGFRRQYQEAQALADEGKGNALLDVTLPIVSVFTAATYVDKYGPACRYDIVDHLPNVRTPLLVTVGGLEATGPQRISFSQHESALGPMAARLLSLSFHLVPWADHAYTGCESSLWGAVLRWAQGVRSAAPAR